MLYLRICFDKQGASILRNELHTIHREYVAAHLIEKNGIKVVQGGPMCAGDDLSRNIGSFLVIEAASLQQAERFHREDPFTVADLFERSEVVLWDRHIGNPDQAEYIP